ncbi:MAG: prepilin-type N-terminal cleavage/methylation domain-containing protein [Chthoniobacterales bacterium]
MPKLNIKKLPSAFTLIELLVVLAITVILAALIFASFQKAREAALSVKCIGRLKNLGVTAKSYIGDNGGFLPYTPDNQNWMFNLAPYMGIYPTKKAGNDPLTQAFHCPSDPARSPRQVRSYRYHQTFPSKTAQLLGEVNRANYVPSRFIEIRKPATHAMLFCVAYTGARSLQLWRFDEALWKESVNTTYPPDQINIFPRPHHNGKAVNVLFSDGHISAVQYPLPPEIWHFDGR